MKNDAANRIMCKLVRELREECFVESYKRQVYNCEIRTND